ncbi:uncharacterized protein G2W53_020462 [Senna tora]|uniref:Uncharacterized protein n=1 Tax=Senna tora TaxID=362788 RepID=A0A834TVW6_9FABA|nr:uncharacterized protein G2W53_020462 [Senna tora]
MEKIPLGDIPLMGTTAPEWSLHLRTIVYNLKNY